MRRMRGEGTDDGFGEGVFELEVGEGLEREEEGCGQRQRSSGERKTTSSKEVVAMVDFTSQKQRHFDHYGWTL